MLTKEHAIAEYRDGRIFPDRLTPKAHAGYPEHAGRMLEIYRNGVGKRREELHRTVRALFAGEADCPVRRVEAFCKLLDDVALYDRDREGSAPALRRRVFRFAAAHHPLVRRKDRLFDHEERAVKDAVAAELGRPWEEIEGELFADVMEHHRLRAFPGYPDGRALLSRYNVAQTQVALYNAVEMTVRATRDFKTILRYAKLARLLHVVRRADARTWEIRLDGPASLLRETRRYGVAMAKFLPALIACEGWRMTARIRTRNPRWPLRLDLSTDDRLTSHLPPPEEFDSSVEEAFARRWEKEKPEEWTLEREGGIMVRGQKAFVPDFVFRRADGREVAMEIVGFWTPEYLKAKMETLVLFRDRPIVLAVAESLAESLADLPAGVILYKTAIPVDEVLRRLAAFADRAPVDEKNHLT